MHIKPIRALYPKLELIASSDAFFGTVKHKFNEYLKSGFFEKQEAEGYYIYMIEMGGRSYTGILAALSMQDYFNDHVISHEKTLAAKEQKSLEIILRRKALIKPVLLTHPRISELSNVIKKVKTGTPFFEVEFDGDNSKHTLWFVKEKKYIEKISGTFKDRIPLCYIADGHHRFAAMKKLNSMKGKPATKGLDIDHILAAFFSFTHVEIYDFNRVLDILGEISPVRFLAELSRVCKLKPLKRAAIPLEKHEMTLFISGEWFRLVWKKKTIDRYRKLHGEEYVLDVALFNDEILKNILHVDDITADKRVLYIGGREGLDKLEQMVNKTTTRVGFCLYPLDIQAFKAVTDAGNLLPPKSTWFEPRMKNGFISLPMSRDLVTDK